MSLQDAVYTRRLRERTPSNKRTRNSTPDPSEQEKYKKRVLEGKEYNDFNPQSLTDLKDDQVQATMAPPGTRNDLSEELIQLLKENGNSVGDELVKELWARTPKSISPSDAEVVMNNSVKWFILGQTNYETQSNVQSLRYAQTSLPNYVTGLANTASALTAVVQRLEKVVPGLEKNYTVDGMTEHEMMSMASSIYRSKSPKERYRVLVDFLVNEMGYADLYSHLASSHHTQFAMGIITATNTEVASAVSIFGSSKLPSLKDQMEKDRAQLLKAISAQNLA
ncbi:phosphoprotein [Joa yellow blotch virus]|uniref:Phosphoprotein n=1 Tax=joa yellow blotch associated virus TaxID=3070922 RepID=A0AAE7USQ6_9RHAB|nr:phosphoprotein [Joa yellow blotch virus]QUI75402.1 phosphoprotein [joa yellow blotch associated virus]